MSAFVFVDYSFMNVAEQQYPNEKQLASFLGVFEGSIMILSLIIQTFVNERLLSMYGMKVALLILPVILMVFTGLALVSGYYFGFEVTEPSFIWFFLFIALSKLFGTTLREATENPVFKLFFMPLDSRVRFDIQTKIEGTINELSRAISGGIILLLGFLPFFELIHYSWILVAIIIGWTYLIIKLYHLYRVHIRLKLERQQEEADKLEQRGKKLLISRLFDSIDHQNPNLMIFALRALSKISPKIFNSKIESIKNDHTIDHTERIIQVLEGDFSFIHTAKLHQLKSEQHEKIKTKSTSRNASLEEELSEMTKSPVISDRKLAAELINATETTDSTGLLIELINDTDPGVIKAAMHTSSELRKIELLPFILDNLQKKNYRDAAASALVNYGSLAFTSLETIFYNSEQNLDIKLEIVNIYGKLGGDEAIDYLWNKIDYPDKNVVSQVLVALGHCGFNAQVEQMPKIKYFIEEDIATIIWNLKAIQKLNESKGEFATLVEAIKEENEHNYAHIYMLLSMIYDQKSIELVKENIETKTNEGISYAIELLDVFLADDLKQKIIPILDDITDIDRIRRLQMYFPLIDISLEDVLRLLINREYNAINRWTKASTILYLGEKRIADTYDMELIANLFNPDLLLRESCAWALYQIDEELFLKSLQRHEPKERNHLQNLILGQKFDEESKLRPHMRFELVRFLNKKTLMGGLPNYILARIADHIEEVYFENKTVIETADWHNECFYTVYSGGLDVKNELGELLHQFEEGDFLGEQVNIDLLADDALIGISGDSLLLKIDKSKFLDLITNEYEVTIRLLDSFDIQKGDMVH